MSVVEDGPLFRATIKALEQKTGNMRIYMKKVLRKAEAVKLAQSEANAAVAGFIDALREASFVNANAIQPALDHYFEKIAREILQYERQNERNLQKLIIDPMTKLYNIDIKQAESKKRDFEEESKDYYAYVSRYLGQRSDSLKGKKRTESDSKYQSKTKEFELKRFDYNSFVQDLHGGRKEQDVLSQLTKYADAQAKSFLDTSKRVQELLPELEALSRDVKEADKEFNWKRTEREEKRRNLEMSTTTYVEPDAVPLPLPSPTIGSYQGSDSREARGDTVAYMRRALSSSGNRPDNLLNSSQTQQANGGSSAVVGVPLTNPSPDRFKGYRDIQETDSTKEKRASEIERRKEGLLWALSRPGSHADPKGLNKTAWHK
jgi:Arf-GAP/SH3 domain/ANK repeat/PH domain-containing protein